MNRKLYVGNLPYDVNDADLHALFAAVGVVESVHVMRERETGRARGFAFVEMATDGDAMKAITNLHETEFGGRRLNVNEARPQEARIGFGRSRGNRGW